MAKQLKDEPIGKADIEEYLDQYSDFAFELKVLNKLVGTGFTCEHSGVYEDPITKKAREFDIRGIRESGPRQLRISVECKNLRDNYPLVAHSVRRAAKESFHELLVSHVQGKSNAFTFIHGQSSKTIRPTNSIYSEGEYVAKSIDQVGRTSTGIVSSDGSVFDKISQAIHSAYDLISAAHHQWPSDSERVSIILPILAVPDNRLWYAKYENDGSRISDPELIDHMSFFISRSWKVGYENPNEPLASDMAWYTLSHLEIVTISALNRVLKDYLDVEDYWSKGSP